MAIGRKQKTVDTDELKIEVTVPMLLDQWGAEYERDSRKVFDPLCNDRFSENPGASYTADEMHYHCWVHGFDGDVIAMVQEEYGFRFQEACEWLRETFL